jgi:hypothetical protein
VRIAWCVGIIAVSAAAAPRPFLGEGNAVIVQGGEVEAQRIATEKATADALMKALGREEPGLVTGGRELVTASRVVSQQVDGAILIVQVEVQVDPAALSRAFGGRTAPAAGGKRVLVLATDQLGPAEYLGWTDHAFGSGGGAVTSTAKTTVLQVTQDLGASEAALADAFRAAGFEVLDAHVLEGKVAARPAAQVLNLSNAEAQKLARLAGVDLVVVATGRASVTTVPDAARAGMVSGQGAVVARVMRVKDGRILGSSTRTAAQVHVDVVTARALALSSAATQASAELLEKLSSNTSPGEQGK